MLEEKTVEKMPQHQLQEGDMLYKQVKYVPASKLEFCTRISKGKKWMKV